MAPKRSERHANVLVVCHGNICRSPLAGAVLSRALGSDRVMSRGFGKPNRPAAKKVREYAATKGYDLSQHRSQVVTEYDARWADVVLYMDGGNLKNWHSRFPTLACNLCCLASYVGLERIADPNYVRRGAQLDELLATIVLAADRAAADLLLRGI